MFESGRKIANVQPVSEHDQELFNNLEMFDDDPYTNMDEIDDARHMVSTPIEEYETIYEDDDEFDFAEVFN